MRLRLIPALFVLCACNHPAAQDAPLDIRQIMVGYAKCWNAPAQALESVTLLVKLNPDANIVSINLSPQDKDRYDKDARFKTAADSAIRAVTLCSPNSAFTRSHYDEWKDLSLTFDPRMNMSETDSVIAQVEKCWSLPKGADMSPVTLDIELDQQGNLLIAQPPNSAPYAHNPAAKLTLDSAISAVRQCGPYTSLLPGKYDAWKKMELSFDPRRMMQ